MTDLSQLTTLRLGGPAAELLRATDDEAVVHALGERPVLVMAGGSNLVVADDGFPGRVVVVATSGIAVEADASTVTVTVAAGETWDDLVTLAVEEGWSGVEALSGIPGSVGATPIQNVGAYGQEVAETVVRLRCWDRRDGIPRILVKAECGFGYRTSRFKAEPDRFVVLAVTFRLQRSTLGVPLEYAELAAALGAQVGDRVPSAAVRAAVLDLRRRKGMVLDDADHDTWSAGSFFTNPFVAPQQLPTGAPAYVQPDGSVKTSAAWLLEHAGFGKGYHLAGSRVAVSSKHALALTNRGGGTTTELVALARTLRAGVLQRFGIELVNEPVLVGCEL